MPNVLLTQRCVRACPYCFAKKHMSNSPPNDIISWENIVYLADFLKNPRENHISLLGGEPSLHPDFVDIVCYLIARGFHISVFTSGIMSNATLKKAKDSFLKFKHDELHFVCNLNDPELSDDNEVARVKEFLGYFGHLTTAGFNIYRKDFKLRFIFDYIKSYYMKRNIRLGIAHPIPGVDNQFISIPDMDIVIKRLYSYLPLMKRLRLQPSFDCGFPICRFTDKQLGAFNKIGPNSIKFYCSPAMDIGPDMSVWNCFPLSAYHRRSVFEFNSFGEMVDYYKKFNDQIKCEITGIYEECDDCFYREDKICSGGCLAHALSKFRNEPKIRIPEMYKCKD